GHGVERLLSYQTQSALPGRPGARGDGSSGVPGDRPVSDHCTRTGAGEAKSVRGATRRPTVPAAVITGAANHVCRSREIEHDNHGADAACAPSPTRATASAATAAWQPSAATGWLCAGR